MSAGRYELWSAVERAVGASFPDRAREILAALESRLEPGPWSANVRAADLERAARQGWTHDRLLAETGRALRAIAGDRAEADLAALEEWLASSTLDHFLRVCLEERLLSSDAEWCRMMVEWAAHALEVGIDSPALRELAGAGREDREQIARCADRAVRELGRKPDEPLDARALTLRIARDEVQGRIEPSVAIARLSLLARMHPDDADLTVWTDLTEEWELLETLDQLRDVREEVRGRMLSLLGAAEPTPGTAPGES